MLPITTAPATATDGIVVTASRQTNALAERTGQRSRAWRRVGICVVCAGTSFVNVTSALTSRRQSNAAAETDQGRGPDTPWHRWLEPVVAPAQSPTVANIFRRCREPSSRQKRRDVRHLQNATRRSQDRFPQTDVCGR